MKRKTKHESIGRLAGPEYLVTDVDAELDFHVEGRVEELMADGWSREDARVEALRQFGDLARYREECREIARSRVVKELRGEMMGNCHSPTLPRQNGQSIDEVQSCRN